MSDDNKKKQADPSDVITMSPWEDGLDCIDSLLSEGSATSSVMTDRQCSGLKNLKAMMLLGVNRVVNHVPRALLDADENSSSDFLLSEYAGYTRPSQTKSIDVILSAHKCARKIAKFARASLRLKTIDVGNEVMNIPAYWTTLDEKSKLKLRDLLSWDSISQWHFNIFDVNEVLKGKHTLVFVAWAILAAPQAQHSMDLACLQFSEDNNDSDSDSEINSDSQIDSESTVTDFNDRKGYNFLPNLNIKEDTLVEFLYAIEDRYIKDVCYHNEVHAADVTQSLHALLQMGGQKFADDKWELFSILIAAVVHDVGHGGLNNSFHINSKSELALLYNDVSVLENMHAATAFRMIMGDNRQSKLDIFDNFPDEDRSKARKFIVKVILSTDMTKHFAKKNFIKGILMNTEDGKFSPCCTIPKDLCLRHEVLAFLAHLADISNPSKNIQTAMKWTDRLLEEFHRQGDKEEELGLPFSQCCDRNAQTREESQIGFINFIVLPSFKLLGELIPRVEKEIVPQIEINLEWWKEQQKLNLAEEKEDNGI
jgi:3',5'-cyclic-nucleotide phosphodiesterase